MGTFRGLYFRGVMVPANIAKIFPPQIFLRLRYSSGVIVIDSNRATNVTKGPENAQLMWHVYKLLHYVLQYHKSQEDTSTWHPLLTGRERLT